MSSSSRLRDAFGDEPRCSSCPLREAAWELGQTEVDILERSKRVYVYEPESVIFYQGNPCSGVHCLESGAVAIRSSHDHDPGEILRIAHPGDVIGLRDLFADKGYSTTAQALTRVRLCFVDQVALRELLDRDPSYAQTLLRRLSREMAAIERTLLAWRPLSVRGRIAKALLLLKDHFGVADETGRITVKVPLSRTELASMVGTRPETLSRSIGKLEADGVALFEGRQVVVPDLDRLLDETETDLT